MIRTYYSKPEHDDEHGSCSECGAFWYFILQPSVYLAPEKTQLFFSHHGLFLLPVLHVSRFSIFYSLIKWEHL